MKDNGQRAGSPGYTDTHISTGGKCAELHTVEVLSEIDTFDEFAKFGKILEISLYFSIFFANKFSLGNF